MEGVMRTEKALAWRQLAITIAMLVVFFLLPTLLPGDLGRAIDVAIKVVVYSAGMIILSRYWRR